MQNEEFADVPYYCSVKVHRLMCIELSKFIERISQISSAIESARPRCTLGLKALCTLHISMEKSKLLIRYCSESSKLYLAITGEKIVLRCEKIRNALELCLSHLQSMVPPLLASQISRIVDDLRIATFTIESSEDEAGQVVLSLLQQDIAASISANMVELKALQVAALKLNITSPIAILIEKRSIKKLLGKICDTNTTKKKILNYFLYLLRKYGKSIGTDRMESIVTENEKPINQSIEPESEKARHEVQVDVFDTLEPPEELKCPLSMRLMYDPVIINSGQTFERLSIENWFSEGHDTCPKTHKKLFDLSMTPNVAIKDLISRWCMEHGIIALDPCPKPISVPLHLQKLSSSSSIASFGSSLKGLRLQISNVSLRSSDTNNILDSLEASSDDSFGFDLPQMNGDSHRFQSSANNNHGINLSFLTKLGTLPWASQRKAVEDVKKQVKDNQGSHSMISTVYTKPLIRFLKIARDFHDSKAQRDGAELLLAFLKECRSEMPSLHEDAFYILSSFLDSEITQEALAIMEVLSSQQHYKSEFLASGVLSSILRILESQISEFHLPAMKILCNLSAYSDIGHHMIYLDFIPNLAPFLGDPILAGYCIKIFRNLCNIEEAGVEVAESGICIASIAEILENGTDEEQEHVMNLLLSLCSQREELCELLMKEIIVSSLVNISVNGNSRGKLIAAELLQLSNDLTDGHPQECPILNTGLNPDISKDSADNLRGKKPSSKSKASGILGRRISIFSKPRR